MAATTSTLNYECISTNDTPFTGTLSIVYTPDGETDEATGSLILAGVKIENGTRTPYAISVEVVGSTTNSIIAQGPAAGYLTMWNYFTYIMDLDASRLTRHQILIGANELVRRVEENTIYYTCVKNS